MEMLAAGRHAAPTAMSGVGQGVQMYWVELNIKLELPQTVRNCGWFIALNTVEKNWITNILRAVYFLGVQFFIG
jgi:hypothetical protein